MEALKQFVSNEGSSKWKMLIYIVGLLYVLNKSTKLACFFVKLFFRKQRNFVKRYGANTYAFITGSSDGIGKQFAIELVKQGMGVVLVARNREKLEKVKAELESLKEGARVRIVVADFKNTLDANFTKAMVSQIEDIEVSMLINNVGMDFFNHFHQVSEETMLDHVKVNCMPMVYLCRHFIPVFRERLTRTGLKSAIMNVGSFAGVLPCVYFHIYGGTKGFVNVFSRTLSAEYPELDIMCLNPSEVSTPMTCNREPDLMTITSNSCAKQALKDLGYETVTAGHWNHKIQTELYLSLPYSLYNYVLKKFIAPEWFKEREAFQNKQK